MVLPARRKAPSEAPPPDNDVSSDDRPFFVAPPSSSNKTPYTKKKTKPRLSDATAETIWTNGSIDDESPIGEDGVGNVDCERTLVNDHEPSPTAVDPKDMRVDEEVEQDEEPLDWDKLAEHEPARKDIQIFLDAQARKEAADDRFAVALDECHASLHNSIDALLQTAADLYNIQRDQMEAIEGDIQHHLVSNDELRAKMQMRLQESATAAQGLFAQLLMRVTTPIQSILHGATSSAAESETANENADDTTTK